MSPYSLNAVKGRVAETIIQVLFLANEFKPGAGTPRPITSDRTRTTSDRITWR